MINGKTVLAIIPARGGSKSVPKKNIRMIAGQPLIAWTIGEAKKSPYIDRLILSSDNEEIINIAKKYGCEVPFVRPDELATDETPGVDPVLHALTSLKEKYDYVILLQPTSPLRTVLDINNGIKKCIDSNSVCCVSVTLANKNPYWMYSLDLSHKLQPIYPKQDFITRRQDLPDIYELNGAIYIASVPWLLKKKTFITNNTFTFTMERSNSFDIDTEIDFEICEYFLKKRYHD